MRDVRNVRGVSAKKLALLGTLSIGIALAASSFGHGQDEKIIPAWHKAGPGTVAYLGDDGGGVDTLTVCDTADRYREWLQSESPPGCQTFQNGLRAVIEVLIFDPVQDTLPNLGGRRIAKIHIPSRGFIGYVNLDGLHPIIPPNTVIMFKEDDRVPYDLYSHGDTRIKDHVEMKGPFKAKLIQYDPSSDTNWDLHVTILDGENAGKSGWMLSFGAMAEDGRMLDQFSNAYVIDGSD